MFEVYFPVTPYSISLLLPVSDCSLKWAHIAPLRSSEKGLPLQFSVVALRDYRIVTSIEIKMADYSKVDEVGAAKHPTTGIHYGYGTAGFRTKYV